MVSFLQYFEGSQVSELDVHNGSVRGLCQLGLHEACPRVHKLTLSCEETVTADVIKLACSAFHHLSELFIKESISFADMSDPTSFCDAVISSCPRLVKLSFSRVVLDNDMAPEILQGLRAHISLKSITWVLKSDLVLN